MKSRLPRLLAMFGLTLLLAAAGSNLVSVADSPFDQGVQAYRASDFVKAEQLFRESASKQPASGALINLGIAEWRRGRAGPAILAWEQALWIDPRNETARKNLDFARHIVQLDEPALRWYEIASMWLPPNVWGWLAWGSLWLAVATMLLPRVLRWRKTGWHQALAALGLGIFLLSLPALGGLVTRSRIGIVLGSNVPLRLTPTEEAETVSALAAGDQARQVRVKGSYAFIKSARGSGWIKCEQFGLICSDEK